MVDLSSFPYPRPQTPVLEYYVIDQSFRNLETLPVTCFGSFPFPRTAKQHETYRFDGLHGLSLLAPLLSQRIYQRGRTASTPVAVMSFLYSIPATP